MSKVRTYEVQVATTGVLRSSYKKSDGTYGSCYAGALYIVTDDPRKIYEYIGDRVISVTRSDIPTEMLK